MVLPLKSNLFNSNFTCTICSVRRSKFWVCGRNPSVLPYMALLFLRSFKKRKLECFWIFLPCLLLKVKGLKKKAIILIYKSLKETFFQKNASTYICFVPDHLEIEFIWISVQGLRRFKKQTEVIISCKLISIF